MHQAPRLDALAPCQARRDGNTAALARTAFDISRLGPAAGAVTGGCPYLPRISRCASRRAGEPPARRGYKSTGLQHTDNRPSLRPPAPPVLPLPPRHSSPRPLKAPRGRTCVRVPYNALHARREPIRGEPPSTFSRPLPAQVFSRCRREKHLYGSPRLRRATPPRVHPVPSLGATYPCLAAARPVGRAPPAGWWRPQGLVRANRPRAGWRGLPWLRYVA